MFRRFNEGAREVVTLAREEAIGLRHGYVGTEHLLLGLLREEQSLGAYVLRALGITTEGVRTAVSQIVGRGEDVPAGPIPFTPRSKKVLELALREALALGHHYVGTEHILLGLAREGEGVANRILLDHGITSQRIAGQTLEALGEPPRRDYIQDFEEEGIGTHYRWLELPPPDRRSPASPFIYGWLLFGASLGLGVLIGWVIWG